MGMPSEDSIIGNTAVMPDNFIAAFAIQSGFQGDDAVTAVAVSLAESGGKPGAVGHNSNGSKDYGLWQINYPAHASIIDPTPGYWDQAQVNASWARIVWQQAGGSWSPWSAYTSGKYKMYVNRAQTAVSHADLDGGKDWVRSRFQEAVDAGRIPASGAGAADAAGAILDAASSPLTAILDIVKKIFDPKTWVSIGIIMAGAVMLLLVGWQLLKGGALGKNARSTVKSIKTVGKAVA